MISPQVYKKSFVFRVLLVVVLLGVVHLSDQAVGAVNNHAIALTRNNNCGGLLDSQRGILHTPNFPELFPVPISCRWIIKGQANKKITLYFTQFYLKAGVHITTYDFYKDEMFNVGKQEVAEITYQFEPPTLVAYKPYVLVKFEVNHAVNMHLRVEKFLMDVYGFNMTYEITDSEEPIRENTCSVPKCSFLGECLANSNLTDYRCHCYPGFFGTMCEFGPHCDPTEDINMCLNGGRCRYLYGSLVNVCQCPADFEGIQCEEPKDHLSEECNRLGCSQTCREINSMQYMCTCHKGYQLQADNRTCKELGQLRLSVSIIGHSENRSFFTALPSKRHRLLRIIRDQVMRACSKWKVYLLNKFGLDSITRTVDSSGSYRIGFHFYCQKVDSQSVENALRVLILSGKFGPFRINSQFLEINATPALILTEISNYDYGPATEGKILTLVCTARGSANLTFEWFHDGMLIKPTLNYQRIWEQIVPDTFEEGKRSSVLNIQPVSILDKGEFMCSAQDFNESDNDTILVAVITQPHVRIDILSISLPRGSSLDLKCMSPDDTRRSFRYSWYHGSTKLVPGVNQEQVEDVLPTGLRLTLKSAQVNANYTCIVSNQVGVQNETSHIYIITGNLSHTGCEAEWHRKVQWSDTAGGGTDIQPCSNGGGNLYYHLAKRHCECIPDRSPPCQWADANFVKCSSQAPLWISLQLQYLRLGYLIQSIDQIFADLCYFVNTNNNKLFIGDLNLIMSILRDIVEQSWNSNLHSLASDVPLEIVFKIINDVLSSTSKATEEEIKDLKVPEEVMKMALLVGSTTTLYQPYNVCQKYSHIDYCMLVNTSSIASDIYENRLSWQINAVHWHVPNDDRKYTVFGGTQITPDPLKLITDQSQNNSVSLTAVVIGDMASFLKRKRVLSETSGPIISDLLLLTGQEREMKHSMLNITFTLPHTQEMEDSQWNTTICVKWMALELHLAEGYWMDDGCQALSRDQTSTKCLCSGLGTYAVMHVMKEPLPVKSVSSFDASTVAMVACILCMCGTIATGIIHLIFWRHLSSDRYIVQVNFCASLLIVNVMLIFCLSASQTEVICAIGRLLVYFFYLAMMSFMMIKSLYTFMTLFCDSTDKGFGFRYFILGWGSSAVLIICYVAVFTSKSKQQKIDDTSHICSIVQDVHQYNAQFLSILIPLLVIIAIHIVVLVLSLKSFLTTTNKEIQQHRRHYLVHILESPAFTVIMLIWGCLAGLVQMPESGAPSIVFLLFTLLFTIAQFICWCCCDTHIRIHLFTCHKDCCQKVSQTDGNSDFRRTTSDASSKGYSRPLISQDPNQSAANSAASHVSTGHGSAGPAISSQNYMRRKEQLQALLGSGCYYQADRHTNACGLHPQALGDPLLNQQPHCDRCQDSGIFDGTESEKLSTASNSLKHSIIHHPLLEVTPETATKILSSSAIDNAHDDDACACASCHGDVAYGAREHAAALNSRNISANGSHHGGNHDQSHSSANHRSPESQPSGSHSSNNTSNNNNNRHIVRVNCDVHASPHS